MATTQAVDLSVLYEQDETAWLEAMAALAADGRYAEMDHLHLSDYLADMAKRDRREVFSRLVVLLSDLLKWEHQPERRTGSWRGTIREQRRECGNWSKAALCATTRRQCWRMPTRRQGARRRTRRS